MYTCASCAIKSCCHKDEKTVPGNCPVRDEEFFQKTMKEYDRQENKEFYIRASEIESTGYGQWPRLKETIVLCKNMGYHKIGLAFCIGLAREAKVIDQLLRQNGFQTVSVVCKTGGVSKEMAGIPEEKKLKPHEFEAMCNPIAQALLLNQQKTDFNIEVGLCVGHDSLFYKYSEALVTTLIAKDRVLAHNPVGAVYCAEGYFKEKLSL
jgi:uncharacterized metal-binding protein